MAASTNSPLSLSPLPQVLHDDPERKIKVFSVLSHIQDVFLPPSPTDFTLQEVNELAGGEEEVTTIVHDPHLTIYSFDFAKRRALFVKTNPEKNLYTAPFFYLAQLTNATHVYSIPLELLERVLLQPQQQPGNPLLYNHNNTSLKSEEQVLFLFSTGRCGSTLLCKVLDRIDGVLGMQEPEPFTPLTGLRNAGGATDDEIVTLLRLCLLAHCKPKIQTKKWIFKFQSQVTEIMDLFPRAFPNSQNLFMYRNAEGVTKSISKMQPDLEAELTPLPVWTALFSGLNWIKGERKYAKHMCTVYWLTTVAKALEFIQANMKVPCVRYEELVADPEKTVRELAKIFKIELHDDNMPLVLDAMKGHSQEGIFTVFEHKGLEEVLLAMRELVANNKEIGDVNYLLPGTLLK